MRGILCRLMNNIAIVESLLHTDLLARIFFPSIVQKQLPLVGGQKKLGNEEKGQAMHQ